jgi:2-polyprenyl-3-methyl-5-hydroxy-6-metoxy-1,4-benzoquinol methylase
MVLPAKADKEDREGLLRIARDYARHVTERNPYIRMLAVSGSVSRPEHGGTHDDVDFFVVTDKGRVWEGFLGCLLQGWRYCRRLGVPRTFLCFNYLVDEGHPEEIDLSHPDYAREFLQLEVLTGMEVYAELLDYFAPLLGAAEPKLFDQIRARVNGRLDGSTPGVVADTSTRRRWSLVYRLLRIPLVVATKWRERGRKRYYPGGYIYSNRRVIRSHFRRAWNDATPFQHAWPSAAAFTRVAPSYQEDVVASPANKHMRSAVREALEDLMRAGNRVLDVGAGTGVDAIWMARRGASVLAVDVASGMVDEMRRRASEAGTGERVAVRQLAVEDLKELLPTHARRYDIILANFGALNLAGDPGRWVAVVARLLKHDGHLVVNVMNRWCLPELVAGFLRLRISFALRRLRGDPISIGDVSLVATLYTPGAFARMLQSHFRPLSVRGLCVLALPPALEHIGVARPRLGKLLDALDRRVGGWPLLRALGDHFLMVLQPKPQPEFALRTRGSITASPVVADVNEDSAPEVVVAAERLYVTDSQGKAVGDWPRRIGGPMASTPTMMHVGGRVHICVGSDDNRLHLISFDGKHKAGFPFVTGGDVFSSPWIGDLNGDGSEEIVFGSDDGGIYALDAAGTPSPGWPVQTAGYVAASPTIAELNGDRVVVIGSWDGLLYVLDRQGRSIRGWPRDVGFPMWSTAAVADVDGDGYAEILAVTTRLFALRSDGSTLPGFPVRLGGYAVASPAVGDIDADGRPEIVVCSDKVYAFRADGRALPGFPVDVGAYIWASPIIVDIDGDGRPEIVVADFAGKLWIISGDGRLKAGSPLKLGRRIAATPTAVDLDGDGFMEILVATWDGRVKLLRTDCPDSATMAPWPAFRGAGAAAPLRTTEVSGAGSIPATPAANIRVKSTPAFGVALRPRVPSHLGVTEVCLDLPQDGSLEGGLLQYKFRGQIHPSPILREDGRYFALIQPLPFMRSVEFSCELFWEDGSMSRLPAEDNFHFRVGMRGLEQGPPRQMAKGEARGFLRTERRKES